MVENISEFSVNFHNFSTQGGAMRKLFILMLPLIILFAQGHYDDKDPREIIEKVRIYKLTEALDLSEEQTVRLFPRLREIRKTEQEFHKQRIETIKKLKDLVKANAEEKEIAKVLNQLHDMQKDRMASQIKEMESLRQLLTPIQQAKFVIFQEDFEREIRDLIREIRCKRLPSPSEK